MASRQAARCAACGGSNVPPNRPMRSPAHGGSGWAAGCDPPREGGAQRAGEGFFAKTHPSPRRTCHLSPREGHRRVGYGRSARAADAILERGELLDADRPARMHAAGRDADLGAEAELAAVGELRRGVVQHDRGVDLAQEFLGGLLVRGDDRVGVVRAVALDMRDRGVDAVDDLRRDDAVEIFGRPVFLGRGFHARVGLLHVGVAAHLAAGIEQHRDERLEHASPRRRDRPAASRRRRRRRCGASWRSARSSSPSRGRRPCRHRHAPRLRDARTPARAPRPARGRPGPCRRAARSRRYCRRGPASIRPTAARSRVGTSWIASSGRSAARRPSTSAAWIARAERKLSEPPRRITALPALRQSTAGIRRHVRAAFVDHADHAERHAHALDGHAVRPRPAFHHGADRIGEIAHDLDAVRHRGDALRVEREAVEECRRGAAPPSPRRHPRHWRRGCRPRCRGSPAPWRRAPCRAAPSATSASVRAAALARRPISAIAAAMPVPSMDFSGAAHVRVPSMEEPAAARRRRSRSSAITMPRAGTRSLNRPPR